uniref:Uncharacterized protein n=1 Tax=Caenorhabditis japonica TaxID=281687 RepID=A0A8R1E5C5_CAEJA
MTISRYNNNKYYKVDPFFKYRWYCGSRFSAQFLAREMTEQPSRFLYYPIRGWVNPGGQGGLESVTSGTAADSLKITSSTSLYCEN